MKYEKVQTIKITGEMNSSIDKLLENLPRSDYSGRCELLRELIEIGLKTMWKKVNRANATVEKVEE